VFLYPVFVRVSPFKRLRLVSGFAGKEFIVFLQDTNPLTFTAAVSALGVSADKSLEVTSEYRIAACTRRQFTVLGFLQINSVCLPRKAGEAVGVIAVLSRDDGWKVTGNVEYNQLDALLRY
jgi:UDP-sugar pyrophosphorylase